MINIKSLCILLIITGISFSCTKKEAEPPVEPIVFIQPSSTNTIMISPGQTINFEIKLTAQSTLDKLEAYAFIGNEPATLFVTKVFTSNNQSEIFKSNYTIPATAPNYTNGELEFRLFDKSVANTPIKVSKLPIMIH